MLKTKEKILKYYFVNPCKHKLRILVLFTILFYCPDVLSKENPVKEELLTGIEKKYSGKSFQADFVQISRLAALDINEKASGKAFFSHPGKMIWEYTEPERHKIITDGKYIWIFRPEENQVMQGDASKFFKAGTGGAFLSDISLVKKNYRISIGKKTKTYVEMKLVPLNRSYDVSSIVIRVSKKDHEIQQIITYNIYDDTTLFNFSNIRFKKIHRSFFEFKIPAGLNIIYMN